MVEIQTRVVLKPVEETVVQVDMSIEQAKLFARLIHQHIAGYDDGPRGEICKVGEEIYRALLDSGIPVEDLIKPLTGDPNKTLFLVR